MAENVHISGSLRRRLTFSLIGGAAILAATLYLVARSYSAQIAQQGQDNILGAAVSSILDVAIMRDGAVEVDFPYASFSMLNTPSDDRVFYAIHQDDTLLTGYEDLPRAPIPVGEKLGFATVEYAGTSLRLVSASRTLVGADLRSQVTVSIAQTQDALAVAQNRISRNVALFGAGFFLLTALLSFWASATTIAPLKRLTQSITRRGPTDLSPVSKPVPSEMAPLVGSLNTLMARLEQSLTRSEEFIAEAAHRVRTPLATVRAHAENTYQRVEREDNRAALRAMMRAVDESSRAAGQLLDHAMVTFRSDNLEKEQIDLVALAGELVRNLSPVAEMKDIDLILQGDAVVEIEGDAILLQNAIRNLIDNALKYSPVESRIELNVTATPRPQVVVCDQGPGFPPDRMQALTNRFSRGENAGDTVGSGLGLTIARDVVAVHGGSIHLSNRAEGGACVTLSF
ncbi:sensor histidine kinase [Aliiroseovarius sp. KMU-50]|uniref:histidine kinase n=1 Tax=Aliiroseovarius salicola TaxID=3009082 RepID=A0ABT4W522_9RHOB|nr:sensor histidine kinase [Aliiroseovarius sp. KMU-50]MDA5095622.1 sensor histidine kinase [Aliiroseovarius sp. KMU-50]